MEENTCASQIFALLYRMFQGCFVLERLTACEMWGELNSMLMADQTDLRDASHTIRIRANGCSKMQFIWYKFQSCA
jgi:hypothetical protein